MIASTWQEIEALGKQQHQARRNRLGVLIGQLLKGDYPQQKRSKRWRVTIRSQRREITDLLSKNPSLEAHWLEAMVKGCYAAGMDEVCLETSLDEAVLPLICPYPTEQLLDAAFLRDLKPRP